MATFRAKKYKNRHDENKLQVSGDQKDFTLLAKDDEATKAEFVQAITEALKK